MKLQSLQSKPDTTMQFDVRAAMMRARLPLRYRGETVATDFLEAEKAKKLNAFRNVAQVWLREGGCVVITESDRRGKNDSVHAAYLTAKAAIHSEKPTFIVDLPTLVIMKKNREMDAVAEAKLLVVMGFNDAHWKAPLTSQEGSTMEWFFRQWIDDGRPILFQCSTSLRDDDAWCSPSFVAKVEETTIAGGSIAI